MEYKSLAKHNHLIYLFLFQSLSTECSDVSELNSLNSKHTLQNETRGSQLVTAHMFRLL